jgi:hypothetical protein
MFDFALHLLAPVVTATVMLALFHLIAEVHIRLSDADGSASLPELSDDVWQ